MQWSMQLQLLGGLGRQCRVRWFVAQREVLMGAVLRRPWLHPPDDAPACLLAGASTAGPPRTATRPAPHSTHALSPRTPWLSCCSSQSDARPSARRPYSDTRPHQATPGHTRRHAHRASEWKPHQLALAEHPPSRCTPLPRKHAAASHTTAPRPRPRPRPCPCPCVPRHARAAPSVERGKECSRSLTAPGFPAAPPNERP